MIRHVVISFLFSRKKIWLIWLLRFEKDNFYSRCFLQVQFSFVQSVVFSCTWNVARYIDLSIIFDILRGSVDCSLRTIFSVKCSLNILAIYQS